MIRTLSWTASAFIAAGLVAVNIHSTWVALKCGRRDLALGATIAGALCAALLALCIAQLTS